MALMSKRAVKFLAVVFAGLVMLGTVEAAGGSHHDVAQAPSVDCSSLVLNMADCLSFVISGSTVQKPQGTCCSGLKTVLKTDGECICEAFKNSAQLGVTLNLTKAVALPAACHVSASSAANCGLNLGNGVAPALFPNALSPSTSAAAPAPFSGANEATQATAGAPGSSGGSSAVAVAASSSSGPVLMALVADSLCLF